MFFIYFYVFIFSCSPFDVYFMSCRCFVFQGIEMSFSSGVEKVFPYKNTSLLFSLKLCEIGIYSGSIIILLFLFSYNLAQPEEVKIAIPLLDTSINSMITACPWRQQQKIYLQVCHCTLLYLLSKIDILLSYKEGGSLTHYY